MAVAAKKIIESFLILGVLMMPLSVQAVRFYLLPATLSLAVNEEGSIALYVDTEGETINAISLSIAIPIGLEVISVETSHSIVNYWVQSPAYSYEDGSVIASGVILHPGLSDDKGLLFTMTVKAESPNRTFTLEPHTLEVLAHDGEATPLAVRASNARVMSGGALFEATPPAEVIQPSLTPPAVSEQPRSDTDTDETDISTEPTVIDEDQIDTDEDVTPVTLIPDDQDSVGTSERESWFMTVVRHSWWLIVILMILSFLLGFTLRRLVGTRDSSF